MKYSLIPLLITLACLVGPWPSESKADLIAHWTFDEPAEAESAVDSVGGFNGAASNVTFGIEGATEATGTAAEFDGFSSLVQIPFDEGLNPASFTFAAWARPTSAGAYQAVVTNRFDENVGANRHGYIIYNAPPTGTWESWAGTGEASWAPIAGPAVELNTWAHVAVTYDGSIPERIFYVNGEEVARSSEVVSPNSSTPINIGAGQDFGDNFFFDGAIDDVAIWDEPLSPGLIQAVMTYGAALEGFVYDPKIATEGTLDFGEIAPNAPAQMLNLSVTNEGTTETLILGETSISGPSASNFSVVSVPESIAPGESGDIEIRFTSLGFEGNFQASLAISSNDAAAESITVALRARVAFTDPLVAHWRFDEPEGTSGEGSVADSKSGYHATPTDVVFGLPGARPHTGTAAQFNGTSSLAQIAHTPDLSPSSFTIAAWANPATTDGYGSVVTNRHDEVPGTTLHGFIIYNAATGNWESWGGTGGASWGGIGAEPVVVNEWVHLAVTYDDTLPLRIFYVDGEEVARSTSPLSPNLSTPFNIGAGQDFGDGFFFNGLIDDVALFRVPLSSEEIQNLIDFGADPPTDPKLQIPGLINLALNGDVQTFEIAFSNTGETETLNLTSATITGDFADNFSVGSFPTELAPGEDGIIQVTFDPLDQTGTISAVLEIESNDPTSPSKLIVFRGFIHDPNLSTPATLDLGALAPNPGPQTPSIPISNLGASKALEISEIRFEGNEASLFSTTSFPETLSPEEESTIELTFDPGSVDGDISAEMIIVSNDPRSPETRVSLFAFINVTAPLVAYFPLDDPAGATSVTELIADRNGTPSNVTFGEPGANPSTGTAARFDGGSSVIQIPFDEAFNPRSFTITAWARSVATAAHQSVITSRFDEGGGANRHGYIIYHSPAGVWESWAGTGEANWGGIVGPSVELDTWTHLAVTYSSSAQERIFYVNGEEAARSTLEFSPNSQQPLNIGAGQDLGDGFFFDGWIDDVGIFRIALTEFDIQTVMNNGVQSITGDPKVSASRLVDFGTHATQPGSLGRTIPITNSGATQTLEIESISLAGPAANRYTLTGDITSLEPGESGTLTVGFNAGGASGVFPATIDIASNDEVEPLMQIRLRAEIDMPNQLLAHYRMNETEGTTMADSSGRFLDGEYVTVNGGTITFGEPALAEGTSIRLSKGGSGASYGVVPQALPAFESFTVSAWIQRDSADNDVEVLFSREGVEEPLWDLALLRDNSIQFFTGGGLTPIVTVPAAVTLGEKHLITLVHDETALTSRLYIDGELAGENTSAPSLSDTVARTLRIAAREDSFSFVGILDDVQIYSRAISAEDATYLFDNPGSALPIEGGEDIDTDGDGLTDAEELELGTSPTNPDTDGDGQSDGAEVIAGTDPLSSASVLKITAMSRTESTVEVTFPGVAGKTYTLEVSANLTNGSWEDVSEASTTADADGDLTLTDAAPPANADPAFYRVRVE